MKRKIILVRHGESADKQTGQTDFDRSLTEKGKISIELLGKFFKEQQLLVESVIASPAVRTKETSMIISNEIDFSINKIKYDPSLYDGSDEYYSKVIQQSSGPIILIGHNPSISYVIGRIAGDFSMGLHPGQCAMIEINEGEPMNTKQSIKLIGPFFR